MTSRRLRAFKRWMTANGIECSDALHLIDADDHRGIYVQSKCKLKEGDLVATIPKQACLTIKTSGAREMIEASGFDGCLGLSVALMYERSLGPRSPWAGYLQLLPHSECLPLVWTLDEVDSLLLGTELHKTMKDDKDLVYEDWKECIVPLVQTSTFNLDPTFFGAEEYFAAKSLVASRSFQIDDYHGSGMVPLADLFNHKTGAENVHFTTAQHSESDDDGGSNDVDDITCYDDGKKLQISYEDYENLAGNSTASKYSQDMKDSPMALEMIIVKAAEVGAEVFNTYGIMGNAALLHRYGFTESFNIYDIVNIDLELVLQWSTSIFSNRHTRARLSLWRNLGYTGCVSENSEYFEISFNGEPQIEMLILLFLILLPEETYSKLDLTLSACGSYSESLVIDLPKQGKMSIGEINSDILLTKAVCDALLCLSDLRESQYGKRSLEDDITMLSRCCCFRERRLYHSLTLRVSERKILEKLRAYAKGSAQRSGPGRRPSKKKLKK